MFGICWEPVRARVGDICYGTFVHEEDQSEYDKHIPMIAKLCFCEDDNVVVNTAKKFSRRTISSNQRRNNGLSEFSSDLVPCASRGHQPQPQTRFAYTPFSSPEKNQSSRRACQF